MAARTRGLLLLLLAVASGLAATYLALRYLRAQARPLLAAPARAGKAVVAARDMPVGTLLVEQDVKVIDWPGNALPVGLISEGPDAVGRGLLGPVFMNEPILETKLAPRGIGGGMPTLIEEGKRALTVRVNEVVGVAGFVRPRTRVDILLTMSDDTPTNEPTTRLLMQNIMALASGQSYARAPSGEAITVPTVTLEVTPEQAETLVLAGGQGSLQMTLRHQLDTLQIETPGARKATLMRPGRRPATGGGGGPRVAVAPTPAQETVTMEIFRGGQRTVQRFNRTRRQEPDTTS